MSRKLRPFLTATRDFGPDRPILVPSPPLSFTTTSRSSTNRAWAAVGFGRSSRESRSLSGLRESPGRLPAAANLCDAAVGTRISWSGWNSRDGSELSSVILELELGSDGTSNVIAGYLSTFAPPLGGIARRRLRVSRIATATGSTHQLGMEVAVDST